MCQKPDCKSGRVYNTPALPSSSLQPNTDEGNALFRKWLINFNSGHSNGGNVKEECFALVKPRSSPLTSRPYHSRFSPAADFSPGQKTSMICDMLSGSTAARAACHYSAGVPYFMHFDDH
jgi:hypothetical protein